MSNVVNLDAVARAQYLEKLEEWGFTEAEAKKLGIRLITGERNLPFIPKDAREQKKDILGAIEIPYFNLDGTPMQKAVGAGDYCRYRFLFRKTGFVDLEKLCKYAQEPGTTPKPFFSKATNWRDIEMEQEPLIITEGEMKANKACAEGYPTIALGGVDSFAMMNERHVSFLPELEDIEWYRRYVYIIYDSDIMEKENVAHAMVRLAQRLVDRGAVVFAVYLPPIPPDEDDPDDTDRKCGLDDFLVHFGTEELDELLSDATPIASAEELIKMNRDWCLVQNTKCIVNLRTMEPVKLDQGTATIFANKEFYTVEYKNGEPHPKVDNLYKAWLSWKLRNDVYSMTYAPGEIRYLEDEWERRSLNIWRGWGVEPKKGTIKPFQKLFDYLFRDIDKDLQKWVWQWLAYPIQNPGVKMTTCIVVHSVAQGTGKTELGNIMGRIYGHNYELIGQTELQSDYTDWIDGRQFVLGDEISGTGTADARRVADRLKHYITGKTIRINEKYIPAYKIPNCTNFLFTSNHPDAFFLEKDDRRFFVVEAPSEPMTDAFFQELATWRDGAGPSALRYHLENVDLEGFNPFGRAPMTDAKEEMQMLGRGDLGNWVYELVHNDQPITIHTAAGPKKGLTTKQQLFTTKELISIYMAENPDANPPSQKAMSNELKKNGSRQVLGGKPVRLKDGKQIRLWALRNAPRWLKMTGSTDIIRHYEKESLKA